MSSASDLLSAVQLQILNNDVSVAMVAIVLYDFILTFPSEVKHIWNKPWTWVSTLFLIVRYVGIYSAMEISLFSTTFVPGPLKVGFSTPKNELIFDENALGGRRSDFHFSGNWAFWAFGTASDLLMVLRVNAMWNRSKIILGILLLFYTVEAAFQLVLTVVFNNPYIYTPVGISNVLGFSVCTESLPIIGPYYQYAVIYPTLFNLLLLVLALIPTVKQSIAMYKVTKQWQPNRYMALIVKEGVAYLLLNLLNDIPNSITTANSNPLPPDWALIVGVIWVATMFPIMPRFVLSMRNLFDQDTRGRFEDIDTAFGISSSVGNVTGVASEIAFADDQGNQGDGEIPLEPIGENDERQRDSFA